MVFWTSLDYFKYKSSRLEMFYKMAFLKNFTKFTGIHLYLILFLIKLQNFNLPLY